MKSVTARALVASMKFAAPALIVAGLASPASAYLGSFTPADGYQIWQNWVDVSYFNSGANGANAGGGAYGYIVPDSGLWKVTPGYAGGIYKGWASRTAALTTVVGNVYPVNPPTAGGGGVYIVGDHGPGRTDNSALAFRNDTPAGTGPARYDYSIDTYDTGGVVPSTVTTGVVTAKLYMLASPLVSSSTGAAARDKFTMSMTDGSGNIGVQWGYAEDNEVYWRPGSSGPWNYTGVYVSSGLWDGIKLDLDLTADTFKIDYYTASTNTWAPLVGTTAMGGPGMTNFTTIGWQLEDDVHLGTGGKNFFDDFSISIPAPTSAGALALAGLLAARRRRA